jgi:hypothetical protein
MNFRWRYVAERLPESLFQPQLRAFALSHEFYHLPPGLSQDFLLKKVMLLLEALLHSESEG